MYIRAFHVLAIWQLLFAASASAAIIAKNVEIYVTQNSDEFWNKTYAEYETIGDYAQEFCREILPASCPFLRSSTAVPAEYGVYVPVSMAFTPEQFLAIDDETQLFSIKASIYVEWQLPSCATWVPEKVCPATKCKRRIKRCLYTNETIWAPSLDFPDTNVQVLGSGKPMCMLERNGRAYTIAMYKIDRSCRFAFQRFPFDSQTCSVLVAPAAYEATLFYQSLKDDFYAELTQPDKLEKLLLDINLWKWANHSISLDPNLLNVTFTFSRKSEVYVCKIFLPTIFLTIMQISTLAMPPETTDRSTYSITAFVAVAVFQSVLTSGFPQTSEVLYLSIYYTIVMADGVLITVYSLVVCRLMATTKFLEVNIPFVSRWTTFRVVDAVDLYIFVIALAAFIYGSALFFQPN